MNFYKFHIGDYMTSTAHLTPLEDIAYRRLIDMYYMTEQPIPKPIPPLSRRLRLGLDELQTVLSEFFQEEENCWRNARCDEEIAAYQAFTDRQKTNGKRGGRKPKKTTANPPITQTKPTANPPQSQPLTTNHKPITNKEEKTSREERASIPSELECIQGFSEEWEKWVSFRKRKGKGIPPTEDTKRRILKRLSERPSAAIIAMQISIDAGWTDIRWEWIDNRLPGLSSEPSHDRPKYDWEIAMEQEAAERARQEAIEAEIAAKAEAAKKQANQDASRIDAPKRVLPPPFPKIPPILPPPQPAPSNEQPKLSLADRKRMLEQDLTGGLNE